jgi:predicted RNA-binding Zn-ribbon protein involved in translation (DUF1610 family)
MGEQKAHPANHSTRAVDSCPGCGEPIISLPVLQCPHCGKVRALRAWSCHPKPGLYRAECIDLDLVAEGKTLTEVIGGLQDAVDGYLKVAFAGPIKGLVFRKSPLWNRVRYYLHRFRQCSLGRPSGTSALARIDPPLLSKTDPGILI